jgi:hypothetical protein
MLLRATTRKKDGKLHRYFSVVESKRGRGGRVVRRHVLYLGEIDSSQGISPGASQLKCWTRVVFAESRDRIAKERSMRRRQLKWLWGRLKELSAMQRLTHEALLMTDHTQRAGEILRRADDRCACANHRRTRVDAHPLHPARARAEAALGETADRVAAAVAAKNHRRSGRFRRPSVVQTFDVHRVEVRCRSTIQGCVKGVPASWRALAGRPEPPQLFVWTCVEPVGVTHGHE